MNKNPKKKLECLKNISPDRDFIIASRKEILDFASINQPEKITVKSSFIGVFWLKTSLALSVIALIVAVGWQANLLPIQREQAEVISVENEWYLADISPYLENVFEKEELAKDDTFNNKLAQKQPDSAISREALIKESQEISLEKPLPILGNDEVDKALDSLVF